MSVSFVDNERHLYPYSGIYEREIIRYWVLGLGVSGEVADCL